MLMPMREGMDIVVLKGPFWVKRGSGEVDIVAEVGRVAKVFSGDVRRVRSHVSAVMGVCVDSGAVEACKGFKGKAEFI